jgi:hypothetical protein
VDAESLILRRFRVTCRTTVNPIARKSASKLKQGTQSRCADTTTYESASHSDSFRSRLPRKSRIAATRSSSSGWSVVKSGNDVPGGKDFNLSERNLLGDTYRGGMIGISYVQEREEIRCVSESPTGAFEDR